jgi:diaminohydroxyphosphoribosylaminopyrimidine deaminase / 5-amino-6-(5-phosphoribosylamino)uracil reductase
MHEVAMDPAIVVAFDTAIAAAAAFRGATAPNPPVGAVTLDAAGKIVAVSAHEAAGEPHAEAKALAMHAALTWEPIDTLVVTLEPCNHYGRTPPCTEAVLQARPRAVWIGALDPNHRVVGGGRAVLEANGIRVHTLSESASDTARHILDAARDLIRPFSRWLATGRPWITIKQALDTTGSMIPSPGRKTFTSREALTFAHQLRRRTDAILTGSGTILADWPEFTVRHLADHPSKTRKLMICDRRHRVPTSYFDLARSRGFDPLRVTGIDEALDSLGAQGCLEVLVEAGPHLMGHMLKEDLWDELVVIRQATPGDDTVTRVFREEPEAVGPPIGRMLELQMAPVSTPFFTPTT